MDSNSLESEESENYTWIQCHLNNNGNEFFCAVDKDFIEDQFNLVGLQGAVKHFRESISLIVDSEMSDDSLSAQKRNEVHLESKILYGLIHARFILTNVGLSRMKVKYEANDFGVCSRVHCNAFPLLPTGITDIPNIDHVKLYCAQCCEIYQPPEGHRYENIDGAFFGTSFPPFFFLAYPESHPKERMVKYEPKLFGFRLHESSYSRSLEAKMMGTVE